MFNSLKEKLRKWVSKTKEEAVEKKSGESKKKRKVGKAKKEKVKKKEVVEKKIEKRIGVEEKSSFFSKFQKKLDEEGFEKIFSELGIILLQNNVAYEVVGSIKNFLKEKLVGKNLKEVKIEKELENSIREILINPPEFVKIIKDSLKENSPFVILFAGINGSGKTTTIAKIAHYLLKKNFSVCLAAADTFRAASIEQLQQHADNLKVHLIKKDYGADPAAVGFDAVAYAKKHGINIVLIDTAGRMQNKDSLMKEIEKIVRVNKPNLKFFVGESITGNDATEQAKTFNEIIDFNGIILSKADVDEKGGTAISVSYVTGKPIFFLGTGQEYQDLEVFDKDKLIKKLEL
jgi:fused signal recognition particle receptor